METMALSQLPELVLQDHIPPAANAGAKAADWLPDFVGSSWLAYGARSSIVITTAPMLASKVEAEPGCLFRQIIDTQQETYVTCVGWAPPGQSIGLLAVALGEHVHIYAPQGFDCDQGNWKRNLELPVSWRRRNVLSHTFQILSFAWTESGDGLLSVGSEIQMWKQNDLDWSCLWKGQAGYPQSLAATTWSAMGFAATAEGDNTKLPVKCKRQDREFRNWKGKAVVWWWDNIGLQDAELVHPQQVLLVQWRPSRCLTCLNRPCKPALLTSCKDGAVRLWLEIETGRTTLDKALRKDGDKHIKPKFVVSLVIEADQSLGGTLEKDEFVTWVSERKCSASDYCCEMSDKNKEAKWQDSGVCEWLLGMGPGGTLALWCLFCLDDIYPPRSPRVLLWKKGTGLISCSGNPCVSYPTGEYSLILIKAVAQRVGEKPSDPPSSFDLFCSIAHGLFQWFHILPPRTGIGGDGLKGITVIDSCEIGSSLNCDSATKSSWEVTSEKLCFNGHVGDIVMLALHPFGSAGLLASLDAEGLAMFWSVPVFSEVTTVVRNFCIPFWRPSGHIIGSLKYTMLTWVPTILPDDMAVLLLGHAKGIDCFSVGKVRSARGENIRQLPFSISHLCSLSSHATNSTCDLQGIWALPAEACRNSNYLTHSSFILGLGQQGTSLLCWRLDINVSEIGHEGKSNLENSTTQVARRTDHVIVKTHLLGIMDLEKFVQVISIAVVPSCFYTFLESNCNSLTSDSVALHCPYDFATGCADGWLKLWKLDHQQFGNGIHFVNKQHGFLCVGAVKIYQGPVKLVAVGQGGLKVATVEMVMCEGDQSVHIWDAETYFEIGGFVLDDRVFLSCPAVALDWLEIGNGQLVLAVATQCNVQVYAQMRSPTPKSPDTSYADGLAQYSSSWLPLASVSTVFDIKSLCWGPKASLVVGSSDHIYIYGQKIFLLSAAEGNMPNISNIVKLECSLPLIDSSQMIFSSSQKLTYSKCGISTIGMEDGTPSQIESLPNLLDLVARLNFPLPVYHPLTMLYHLFLGNQQHTWICVQHLAHVCLRLPLASASSEVQDEGSISALVEIPGLPPLNYLQADHDRHPVESFLVKRKISTKTSSFSLGFNKGDEASWLLSVDEHPTKSSTIGDRMRGDGEVIGHMRNQHFKMPEVDLLVKSIHEMNGVPFISDNEKLLLLAIIDLLHEMDSGSKLLQYSSLDQPGQRFWLAVHFGCHYLSQKSGKAIAVEELVIGGKAMAWALQSECKDTLINSCLPDQLSWPAMRSLGVGFWFTDIHQLRLWMEKLARAQYLVRKDPKDCALLYLALNRQSVLMGLFKLGRDDKDKALVEFLARNFQEEKNQMAALKNAYVLMGKHQYNLAAAFFLLGGDLNSAVGVCAKNLGDLQLAFVICRLREGCDGRMERDLIVKLALPHAKAEGDPWCASLFQWLLGEKIKAIEEFTGKLRKSCITLNRTGENTKRVFHVVFSEKIGPVFVDPDIGHYCSALAGKPSVRALLTLTYAVALSKWLISKTASSLGRIGLPLEALEHLASNSISEFHSSTSCVYNMDDSRRGPVENLASDILLESDMLSGWISESVSIELLDTLKENLVLQCTAHSMQNHPHWKYGRLFDLCIGGSEVGKAMKQQIMLLEEYDEMVSETLAILERKYSINIFRVVARLAILAQYTNHWYFRCRLTSGVYSHVRSNEPFHLATDLSYFPFASYILDKAAVELVTLLSHAILACDNLATGVWKELLLQSQTNRQSGTLPAQSQEMLCLAFDLRLLAAATIGQTVRGESDNKERRLRAIIVLAFTLCVVAAWQGRHAGALLILLGVCNHRMSTFLSTSLLEADLDKCLQEMYFLKESGGCMLENRVRLWSGTDSSNMLSEEDTWRVLGVALWDKLLYYIRKQLTGDSEGCTKDFDHVFELSSPSWTFCQSPRGSHSHPEHSFCPVFPGNMEHSSHKSTAIDGISAHLLKSIAIISHSFQRQLGCYLKLPVGKSLMDSLADWLWGRNFKFTETCMICASKMSPNLAPEGSLSNVGCKFSCTHSDGNLLSPCEELWRILVVRDHLCSVLEMEGVSMPQTRSYNSEHPGQFRMKISGRVLERPSQQASLEKHHKRKENAAMAMLSEHTVKGLSSEGDDGPLDEFSNEQESPFAHIQKPKKIFDFQGEPFQAMCINSCCLDQVVIASHKKGLVYLDLKTGGTFTESQQNLWCLADWPRKGWAKSESTPVPTFVSPGVGLGSKEGSTLGLGGATVGLGTLARVGKEFSMNGAGYGIPGYGGVGVLGLGWEDWEDFDGFVDPPATVDNVSAKSLAAHPLQPFFLAGSSNTHIYLWEFGKSLATATYGVLPVPNVSPPYVLASVSAVQFGHCGHRFSTAAVDGTVCTWQLEVGGRSNVWPSEYCVCFDHYASDVAFVGASGGIIAATGSSPSGYNLIVWDTLAPPNASRVSVFCHEDGAQCLSLFDHDVGGCSISPLIVTGGKGGDIAVHDFRFIATGKAKWNRHTSSQQIRSRKGDAHKNQHQREQSMNGLIWYIPKAHSGSITAVSAIPGTSLFLTGSKDGDVKLWNVNTCGLVRHWRKVHEKHIFLQHNTIGVGPAVQASVTNVQPLPFGFVTCGGDGIVKLFSNHPSEHMP